MNKKVLLFALPIIMALSSCAGASASPKENRMLEDTLAHEEIFGEAQEGGKLGFKAPNRLASLSASSVKIGYQINYDSVNQEIAIRFVAAIKDTGVKAYWHRGFAQANGNIGVNLDGWKYKFDEFDADHGKESTKYYVSLTDGGEPIKTGATEGTAGYTEFNGFVIYTLKGIPYNTYKDSYLAAYVTLIDPENGENRVSSQAIAVKIERDGLVSKNDFSFDPSVTGHFLQGKIGGVGDTLLRATEDTGYYYAHYPDLALDKDDYFGSFYYSPSAFQFCGCNSYFVEGSSVYMEESNVLGEYASPKASGTYSLYVHSNSTPSENQVFTVSSVSGANQNYKVYGFPSFVNSDGCVVFASVHLAGGDTWVWKSVTLSGTTGTFVAPNNCSEFLLVRCVSGTTEPNWGLHDPSSSAGRIYNQTPNISITANYYCISASSWNEYH